MGAVLNDLHNKLFFLNIFLEFLPHYLSDTLCMYIFTYVSEPKSVGITVIGGINRELNTIWMYVLFGLRMALYGPKHVA
jgi:hypothetical protein